MFKCLYIRSFIHGEWPMFYGLGNYFLSCVGNCVRVAACACKVKRVELTLMCGQSLSATFTTTQLVIAVDLIKHIFIELHILNIIFPH